MTTRQITKEEKRELAVLALREYFGPSVSDNPTGLSLGDRAEAVMDAFSRLTFDRFGSGAKVAFIDPGLVWNADRLVRSGQVEVPVL